MKKQLVTLLYLLLMATSAFAGSLLEKYPQTTSVTLSTGDIVDLPLHMRKSSGVVLAGLADLSKLDSYLKPHELRPLPVTKNKGLVMLFAMNYKDTSIGAYQELVMLVASTNRKNSPIPLLTEVKDLSTVASVFLPLLNNKLDSAHKKDPFYTWKLFVTTPIAMNAGIEIWGYPKSLAEVDVSANFGESHFRVMANNQEVISAVRRGEAHYKIPLSIDMRLISPITYKQVSSRGIAQGHAHFEFFDKDTDTFELNPKTQWGSNLLSIGFKPLLWLVMPDLQAVFLPVK